MLYQRERRLGSQRAVGANLSRLARRLAFGAAALALGAPAWAGPEGERVVAGQAVVHRFGPYTSISASNGAIINYRSFNIGTGERVQFFQPGPTARVLNRIDGGDPTTISGSLVANGIVYIMNPAGVYFRQGAVVNVGTIYAGAAHLSDADFLAGNNRFTGVSGPVSNEGVINAKAAHLVGQVVSNAGMINAPGGVVTMTSGDEVLIGESGGNVFVRVTNDPARNSGEGGTGQSNGQGAGQSGGGATDRFARENAAVSNTGTINAPGGRVALTAGDVYGMAIFGSGQIKGRNVTLEGQGRGVVEAAGVLDASSASGRGGDITVTGEHVRLQGATLDASGATRGGTVRVGGDFQGRAGTRQATTTYVDGASRLSADGGAAGSRGGQVVVWSNTLTGFYGTASAQGGRGGAGGMVETSGKVALDVRGATIRAGAVDGVAGTWLLDPSDVTIRDSASSSASVDPVTGAYTISGDSAIVNAADITSALAAGANVTITTNNAGGTQQGNITVGDIANGIAATINPVLNSGNVSLTLQAANNITINSNASIAPSGANRLGLVLSARDAAGGTQGSTGSVTIAAPLSLGSLSVTGRTISLSGGTITTTGDQTYVYNTPSSTQGLVLGAATSMTSTGGNITLGQGGNVGTIRGANSLTLSAPTGTITFNTTIGSGSSAPTTLSASAAAISITGGFIRTSGSQSYTGPITVNTVGNSFNFTGTNLTFSSTLRSQVNNEEALTVNATGLATYNGAIGGGGGNFSSVTMSGAGGSIAFNGGSVTTSGRQLYINNVTLGADSTFTSTSGTVQFDANVEGAVAGQQSLTVAGNAVLSGAVGGTTALEFVNVSGTTQIEDTVFTSGAQTYGGAVTLNNGANNVALQGSTITFNGTVNTLTGANTQNLDITGDAIFNAAVGASLALASLQVSGTTGLNANVTTGTGGGGGNQTYVGGVTLGSANGSSITLTTNGGLVTFGGAVDATAAGQQGLVIAGDSSFGGAVGGGQALSSLSVSGASQLGASTITTTGAQTYTGAVSLTSGNGTVVSLAGSSIGFGSAVDASGAGQQGLSITGNASFGGSVGATALRSLSVSGTTSLATTTVATTNSAGGSGDQTYSGAVTLNTASGSTVTLTSTGGAVNFGSTLNGAGAGQQSLILSNNASFGGIVGGTGALRSLSVGGTTALNTTGITTTNSAGGTGNQTYTGAVTIGGGAGSLATLASTGGLVSFGSTVNASGAGTQGLIVSGNGAFGGVVGGLNALRELTVSGSTALNTTGVTTSNAGGGSGNQSYTGAVTLNGGAGSTTTLTSTGGLVGFGSTINATTAGQQGLAIGGNVQFGGSGAIGGSAALRSLAVSGTTQLGSSSVNTTNSAGGSGNQTYSGAVTLIAANGSTQTLASTGGTVSFGSTLNANVAGQQGLAITGAGAFGGDVGGAAALRSLSVSGATTFNSGATTVATTNSAGGSGAQTYSGAVTLNTGNDTVLTMTATGATVSFGSTIDAASIGEQGLVITGNAGFGGAVGSGAALRSLAVGGASAINTTTIATSNAGGGSGDQTYTGAATLGTANGTTVTLTSTGGTVGFGAGVGATTAGQQGLAVAGNASFTGGTTTALRALSVSGVSALNGGTIATTSAAGGTGSQAYSGAVTLNGGNDTNTTLVSTGGTVSFGSTVDATTAGEQGLIVTGAGAFGGNVGGTAPLRQLAVSGTATLPALVVTSASGGGTGNQTYSGAATLSTDAVLTSGAGTVTFGSTLNGTTAGQEDLTINGAAVFGGAVGGGTALGNLGVTLATTINGGTITTTGLQNYNGAVTLGGNTTLNAGAGDITFGATVDAASAGGGSLTLNSTGTTTLGGSVGATRALSSLTTNAGGTTDLAGATITTTGAQTYNDDITLASNVTINGSTVLFGGAVDGTNASQEGLLLNANPTLNGSVGGGVPLAFLTINGVLTLVADTTFNVSSISLANVQSTGGPFNLTLTCATLAAIGNTSNPDNSPAVNNLLSNGAGVTQLLAGSTIRTAGTQTFSSAGGTEIGGTVGQNVTLISGGAVSFTTTIDSSAGGSRGLVVDTAADTTFGAAIGATSPLSHLQTMGGGTTFLAGGTIATDGATVVFDDAVVLSADTTISDSGGGVFFNNTVDSDATGRALTVNTPGGGTIRFGADVGASAVLTTLTTTTTGGSVEFGRSAGAVAINTSGAVDIGGAVLLNADTTFNAANNSDVRFRSTVDSFDATARALSVNSGGNTLFDASIGAGSALASLATDAGGLVRFGNATNGGAGAITINVSGAAGLDIGEQLVFDADTTINATNASAVVRFRGPADSLNGTARDLAINNDGSTIFNADLGNAFEFDTINVVGGTLSLGDGVAASLTVSSNNAQTYQTAITLNTGNVANSLVSFGAAAGGVSFASVNSTVPGVQGMSVSGDATFNGAVGGTSALQSLMVTGATTFAGGSVATLDTSGQPGAGRQTYTGPVTLAGPAGTVTALTSNLAADGVVFGSTIDATTAGEQGLAITGSASFGGNVGGTTALRSLSTTGAVTTTATTFNTTNSAGGSGDQTYGGAFTLNSANDSIVTFSATGGTVTFSSTLDAAVAGEQGASISGDAVFGGAVGGIGALSSLAVSGASSIAGTSVTTTNAGGGTGDQSFTGLVTLNSGDDSTVTFTSTGGLVSFTGGLTGTTSGEQTAVVAGDAAFGGSTTVALGGLSVSGTTSLGGVTIDTTSAGGGAGNQTYTGAVTLTGAPASTTTLTSAGGAISFASTIDAQADHGQNLAITTTGGGSSAFNGAVGGANALASLSVTGASAINTTALTTTNAGGGTGNQTFDGTVSFGTGNDSTITFTATGGTVSFTNAIDAQAAGEQALVIAGNGSFGGAVGAGAAFASLAVSGATTIAGASVNTTNTGGGNGAQTYTGAVSLTGGAGTTTTFSATGGTVAFGSTLDASSAGAESVVITGNATLGGAVGGTNALGALSVSGVTQLNTTSVRTSNVAAATGNQTYSGAVTLGTPTGTTVTLTATGGSVSFGSGLSATTAGEQSLAIVGNGSFAGSTGTALGALSVSGTTQLGAVTLTTTNAAGGTGNQAFTGGITLNGANDTNATLVSTGGAVTIGGPVNATTAGEQGLVITGNGTLGSVGSTTALRLLSVSGTSQLNGTAYSTTNAGGGTGAQTYTGAVTLGAGAGAAQTFTAAGGTVAFGSTLNASINGAETVTINGSSSFAAAVGGIARLFRLNANGAANVANDVMTTAGQLFAGDLTLSRAAADNNGVSTFDGGGGPMTFQGNILATTAGQQGIVVRTTGATRVVNGVASPNGFPNSDGQIGLFRAYQPPIGFGGSIGATGPGDNAHALRSVTIDTQRNGVVPAISTVVFAPGITAENRIPDSINAATLSATTFSIKATDTVTIGYLDKVLAFGSLEILGATGNTLNSARVSDITALRDLTITADQIAVRRRAGSGILGQSVGAPSNTVANNDLGVDFLGQTITFSVEPFVHDGDISAPTQIPGDAVRASRILSLSTPDGTGVNVPNYTTVQAFGSGDLLTQFADRGPAPTPSFFLPFDLRSQGPVNTSISSTIAAFVVVEPPDIQTDTGVGSALRDQLREIGIITRDLGADELVEFLVGRALYDDRSASADIDGRTQNGIAVGRLAADIVKRVLIEFKEIKEEKDPYRDAISEAYLAFLETDAGKGEVLDVLAFHDFVLARSESDPARTAFIKLAQLFQDLDQLGLGPAELAVCKRKIVGFVRPSDIDTDDDLVRAIEAHPALAAK